MTGPSLIARAPDAASFAPFGALIEPPQSPGDRRMYSDWLVPVPGLALQFHLNHIAPTMAPVLLTQIEHHPHAAQVFVPLDVARYLVTVMPRDDRGAPDAARAISFVMPGTLGVVYRRCAWHAGITVLDRPGSFAVFMARGADDDDVILPIAPLIIALPRLGQTGMQP